MTVLPDPSDARLEDHRRELLTEAWAQIKVERLRDLVVGMVDIPSPTGAEAVLAQWLTGRLEDAGLHASYQAIDDEQGNATGRLRGGGTGPDLLLYAPIDTLTVGTAEEDVPWVGPELRPDLCPRAVVEGDYVMGLGAANPKAHAACVVAAAEAVAAAGIPLTGDLLVGLGAGGMPVNKREVERVRRYNAGQGNGCSFLLEQGFWADYAVIAKPGWATAWEEVGLCWFELSVHGTYHYVGSRHRMPYRNPIVDAAKVVEGLERWFPQYSAAHTDGLVAPQGHIGSIRGGWTKTAAVSPATCRLRVDLRTNPRSSVNDVRREFGAAIDEIRAAHPGLDVDWELVLAIPGTSTPVDNWVCRASVAAWEQITGRPHEPIADTSGATDANILRLRGIPTARIGMDRIGPGAPLPLDFPSGMNVADVREMERLTRHLVHMIINTCTRERAECAAMPTEKA
ncbi:zinc-binding metallopeptidase family protein [Actinomadura montaniterrae]|uniref:Peptidase dimerization domain-containing protein n=1 Tax=Actinomadura montaniterrae TaxID=1803903 RepID=A0A6L3W1I8_9ACTN|nr:peptidase dimerization domain-containing protein [Actinomadura montaniterrae]KAB2388766.1 peptidase dimerization domain-containing protein [Actinomadura montaniterrae]